MLRKQAATAELHSLVHQPKEQVLALLADRHYVFQLDNEFTVVKLRCGLLTRGPHLGGPWRDKVTLQNQPPLSAAVDERDFQHAGSRRNKGNEHAKPKSPKAMNSQRRSGSILCRRVKLSAKKSAAFVRGVRFRL